MGDLLSKGGYPQKRRISQRPERRQSAMMQKWKACAGLELVTVEDSLTGKALSWWCSESLTALPAHERHAQCK